MATLDSISMTNIDETTYCAGFLAIQGDMTLWRDQ